MPLSAGTVGSAGGVIGNLPNQLIRTNPADRTTLEGDLAESWTVSDDGIAYTFKIRDGIVDHEGNPFTAEDVWYQFVRVVDRPNEVPGNTQACLRAYIKPVRDGQGNLLPDAGAEVTGPNEVTVRLTAARAAFIPCLAGSFVPFLPDTYTRVLDESGEEHRDLDPTKGELIGTGPFKVKSVAVENQAIWERSEQFFREGLPYLDELNIVHIPDAQAMRANFLAGPLGQHGSIQHDTHRNGPAKPGQAASWPGAADGSEASRLEGLYAECGQQALWSRRGSSCRQAAHSYSDWLRSPRVR